MTALLQFRDLLVGFVVVCAVMWGVLFMSTHNDYYTYYDDSGRIDLTVVIESKSPRLISLVVSDSPEARKACAKDPPFFLVRPFHVLLGEFPCYHKGE